MAKEKRAIEHYAKEYISDDCTKSIVKRLSILTGNSGVKLPRYISFILYDNGALLMYLQEQTDNNGKPLNPLTENMQGDNAAFEGWAIVLKAWLSDEIKTVRLKWDIPSAELLAEKEPKASAYRRFCYRVARMTDAFEWFSIDNSLLSEIASFRDELVGLQNNSGESVPQKKFKHGGGVGENAVEYDMVHEQDFPIKMRDYFNVSIINHQLPVGVKKDGKSFFSGSKAAIDLWGLNGDELTIIELKYENEMVGIISELFFYVCLMRDIVTGFIAMPEAILPDEKTLYSRIHDIRCIHARMLADIYHPLIENERVFEILNGNRFQDIKVDFDKTTYKYTPSTLTIE